jgi:hypothetical protein
VKIFYATFSSVFRHVETWQTQGGDLLLVGSEEATVYDVALLRERIQQSPFREGLQLVWRTDDLEGIFSHYVSNDQFPRAILTGISTPLNTDDRPLLEFAFARGLSAGGGIDISRLRREAANVAMDRPQLRGELDWNKVERDRVSMFASFHLEPSEARSGTPEQQQLFAAFQSWTNSDLPAALARWKELGREPANIMELIMVAECMAEAGEEATIGYVQKMREKNLPEAQAVAARFLWRQERQEEASEMLEAAFTNYRRDPWVLTSIARRTLGLAAEIGAESGTELIALRLYQALQKPFAVYHADEARRDALLRLAVTLDQGKQGPYTLAEVEAPEPHIPWTFDFLRLREAAYRAASHPRAAAARRDLETFLRAETAPVGGQAVPSAEEPERLARAGE